MKSWYKSLTLGVNGVVVLTVLAQMLTNNYISILTPEQSIICLAIVNSLIRLIQTKTKLTLN